MWPRSPRELVDAQRALAAVEPPPWRPATPLAVGACFVCFPRGETGAGVRGDRAWAAATVLRGRRALANAQVIGEADAPRARTARAARGGLA